MPLGERFRLTGLLLNSSRGPILQMDDGGVWALDIDDYQPSLGARITVEGIRTGFDRLDVEWFQRAGPADGRTDDPPNDGLSYI